MCWLLIAYLATVGTLKMYGGIMPMNEHKMVYFTCCCSLDEKRSGVCWVSTAWEELVTMLCPAPPNILPPSPATLPRLGSPKLMSAGKPRMECCCCCCWPPPLRPSSNGVGDCEELKPGVGA